MHGARRALIVSLASVGPALFGGAFQETEASAQERRRPFHAVVGAWSAGQGGEWIADGTTWSGTHTTAEATAAGAALFRAPSDAFIANVTAPGAFPLSVWTATASFTAGTISSEFKLIAGESDQTAGIAFDLKPTGDYLFVRYNTKDGNVAVWSYSEGQRRVIEHGAKHTQLAKNAWHPIAVTITGRKISGQVGTDLVVDYTHSADISGRVGLWTKRDSVTAFRNFTVRSR